MRNRFLLTVAFATLGTSIAHAQGASSLQGLGYPPGELSTRALGTGGALAETDSRSPVNPASLARRPDAQVFAQYDPEFRSVTTAGRTASTTTARLPLVGGFLPLTPRLIIGLTASTYLDRTWQTSTPRTQVFGADTASWTESFKSEGAITDVRVAAAYAVSARFRVGVAFHTFPGSLRLISNLAFTDTLKYANLTQLTNVGFSGKAVSAGFEADVLPSLLISASGEKGGTAKMFANDSLQTTANIPDRYSGSIVFSGIPGTLVAVRASRQRWSSLNGLTLARTGTVDANDLSAGIESSGPKFGGGFPLLLRIGARRRTLPFEVGNSPVQETSYGGGLGVPISLDRVTLDMSLLRSVRTGVAGVSEHAYNLSFGLQVRP